MKLISHRGNTKGRQKLLENHPNYIRNTIDQGFDVEVDVWITDNIYFGHDDPCYKCSMNFLVSRADKLWIHCKNLRALEILNGIRSLNIFWHQKDDYTLTSKGYIWTYPKKNVCGKSVIVTNDATKYSGERCYGLCADILTK